MGLYFRPSFGIHPVYCIGMKLFLVLAVITIIIAEIEADCSKTVDNSPGGTIAVEDSGTPTECNKLCLQDPMCLFWTMRKDIDKCWLFGFTTKFNSNTIVYASGVKCQRPSRSRSRAQAQARSRSQDCSKTVNNSPGGVVAIQSNTVPTECDKLCRQEPSCQFWTMRKDIDKCWLFGFTGVFDLDNGEVVYVSGKRCP